MNTSFDGCWRVVLYNIIIKISLKIRCTWNLNHVPKYLCEKFLSHIKYIIFFNISSLHPLMLPCIMWQYILCCYSYRNVINIWNMLTDVLIERYRIVNVNLPNFWWQIYEEYLHFHATCFKLMLRIVWKVICVHLNWMDYKALKNYLFCYSWLSEDRRSVICFVCQKKKVSCS